MRKRIGSARLASEGRAQEQTYAKGERSMKQHTYRFETGAHTA